MPSLQVVLYGTVVGALVGDSWRDFDFVTSSEGLDRFGIGSTVLSESVPLVLRQPRGKAARRRNFFAELLPEDSARLAPAYDVVPLTHYPGVDGRMAMSVNGVYDQRRISRGDLIAEVRRWGLGTDRAEVVVEQTVSAIRETAQHEKPHARANAGLPEAIDTAAGRLVEADNATRS